MKPSQPPPPPPPDPPNIPDDNPSVPPADPPWPKRADGFVYILKEISPFSEAACHAHNNLRHRAFAQAVTAPSTTPFTMDLLTPMSFSQQEVEHEIHHNTRSYLNQCFTHEPGLCTCSPIANILAFNLNTSKFVPLTATPFNPNQHI